MGKIIQKIYTDKGIIILGVVFYFMVSIILQLPSNAVNPAFIPNDSQSYLSASHSLFSNFQFDPIRPWGYPFLIGIAEMFGQSQGFLWFIWFLQFISWLAVLWMVFRICKSHIEPLFGFTLVLAFLSFSSLMLFTWLTLTESIFTFLITHSIYKLIQYVKHQKISLLHLSFASICFSATLRPTTLYFAILALIGLFVFYKIKKIPLFKNALISLAIFMFTIGTQLIAMKVQFNISSPSIIGKMAWYEYLGTHSSALKNRTDLKKEREDRKMLEDTYMSNISGDQYWKKRIEFYDSDFKLQIKDNKLNIAKAMFTNIKMNVTEHSAELSLLQSSSQSSLFVYSRLLLYKFSRWQNIGMNLLLLLLCGIISYNFITKIRKFFHHPILILISIVCALCVYLLLISGFSFWQGDRFSVVYYPLILIGLALTLSLFKPTTKEKRILES